MTKHEAVGELARARFVERVLSAVARHSLTPSMKDLAQNVYESLLGQPEEKIVGMAERGELRYFAVRMVINQYSSRHSHYHFTYRRWLERAVDINDMEIADNDN